MGTYAYQLRRRGVAAAPQAEAESLTTAASASWQTPVPGRLHPVAPVRVGANDDRAEVEADTVADRVVSLLSGRLPDRPAAAGPHPLALRRRPDAAGEGVVGAAGGPLGGSAVSALRRTAGGGAPLTGGLRRSLEGALGADLGGVRLHEGPTASRLSREVSAEAFTLGRDVYFRDGIPDAGTDGGLHLLAHELAHTVQDGGAVRRKGAKKATKGKSKAKAKAKGKAKGGQAKGGQNKGGTAKGGQGSGPQRADVPAPDVLVEELVETVVEPVAEVEVEEAPLTKVQLLSAVTALEADNAALDKAGLPGVDVTSLRKDVVKGAPGAQELLEQAQQRNAATWGYQDAILAVEAGLEVQRHRDGMQLGKKAEESFRYERRMLVEALKREIRDPAQVAAQLAKLTAVVDALEARGGSPQAQAERARRQVLRAEGRWPGSNDPAKEIAVTTRATVGAAGPERNAVVQALDALKAKAAAPWARKWGEYHGNNAGLLPGTARTGGYKEYYVSSAYATTYPARVAPGTRRLVASDDGKHVYYSPDHYTTFLKVTDA